MAKLVKSRTLSIQTFQQIKIILARHYITPHTFESNHENIK